MHGFKNKLQVKSPYCVLNNIWIPPYIDFINLEALYVRDWTGICVNCCKIRPPSLSHKLIIIIKRPCILTPRVSDEETEVYPTDTTECPELHVLSSLTLLVKHKRDEDRVCSCSALPSWRVSVSCVINITFSFVSLEY